MAYLSADTIKPSLNDSSSSYCLKGSSFDFVKYTDRSFTHYRLLLVPIFYILLELLRVRGLATLWHVPGNTANLAVLSCIMMLQLLSLGSSSFKTALTVCWFDYEMLCEHTVLCISVICRSLQHTIVVEINLSDKRENRNSVLTFVNTSSFVVKQLLSFVVFSIRRWGLLYGSLWYWTFYKTSFTLSQRRRPQKVSRWSLHPNQLYHCPVHYIRESAEVCSASLSFPYYISD